jgi:hypothetical protein
MSVSCVFVMLLFLLLWRNFLVWCSSILFVFAFYFWLSHSQEITALKLLYFILGLLWFRVLDVNHFEFFCVYDISLGSHLILLPMDIQFSQCHLLKKLSFPQCVFLELLLSISCLYRLGLSLGSWYCSIAWCVVFMLVLTCLDY